MRYLSRGLALYESLAETTEGFHLYVLTMDEDAEKTLAQIALAHMTLIPLQSIETPELLAAKRTRSHQEYCWTCTPAIVRYCINVFKLDACTYVDADTFFFENPQFLLDQLGGNSVLITPHFYAPEYDQTRQSGVYCVQFTTFRNDAAGMRVLEDWYSKCIDWCFARIENGRFGDQKYLDEWTEHFKGVAVSYHEGGGVAPWNLKKYDLVKIGDKPVIRSIASGKRWPVVFYHFHDLYFREDGMWYHKSGAFGYDIGEDAYRLVYAAYLRRLFAIGEQIGFLKGVDFPQLPKVLTVSDFERALMPRIDNLEDRDMLRGAYEVIGDRYWLRQVTPPVRKRLFEMMLENQLNLSAVTLWEEPDNQMNQRQRYLQTRLAKFESSFLIKTLIYFYRYFRSILK